MTKYAYLNLAIGAPRRLAALRAAAEKLNAQPHRVNADKCNWRDVRYASFTNCDASLNQGAFNDAPCGYRIVSVPIWYTHAGPAFPRETWCDEVENVRIDHTGWYADPDGCDTYRGFVVALPHGRFMGGYEMRDSGERVYFADLFDDAREAARFADGRAEWYAQQECDYQTRWRAAQDLHDEIEEKRGRLLECLALRNNPCFKHVRKEVARCIEAIRDARETLQSDYADIDV